MDPFTGAAIGNIAGGVLGSVLGSGDRKRAEEERRRALDLLYGTNAEMGRSAVSGEDPEMRHRASQALAYLQNQGREGGMDAQSKAALSQAQASNAAQERMGRGAIEQNFAMRGSGGSGAALAASLANQQGSANRNAVAGAQAAGDARTRAMQAMLSSGQMAQGVRGQDFQKAGMQDAVSRFNADARLRKAGMVSGAANTYANSQDASADRSRFDVAQLGQAGGAGLAGYFGKKDEEGY